MEVLEAENDEGMSKKISTLVFMDLETTGLPSDVGTRNVHITEMALVAVDRRSFEEDKNFRVINKISLCVRPRCQISPGSMGITGLYNDILENQEEFDDSVPKMLEYFFRRLRKPICLLAHNGNRFDFPVLQAELRRLDYTLGSDIVCVDTLIALRSICSLKKQAEADKKAQEEDKKARVEENGGISEADIENLLSDGLDFFSQIDAELASVDKKLSQTDLTEAVAVTSAESKDIKYQNETTPHRSHTNSEIGKKRKKNLDPAFLPKNMYKRQAVPAKRALFQDPAKNRVAPEPCPEIHNIKRFSLTHLYHFFFDEDPLNSHYAEVDCLSLSKVCQIVGQDFLNWIDKNNVAFSMIDALW